MVWDYDMNDYDGDTAYELLAGTATHKLCLHHSHSCHSPTPCSPPLHSALVLHLKQGKTAEGPLANVYDAEGKVAGTITLDRYSCNPLYWYMFDVTNVQFIVDHVDVVATTNSWFMAVVDMCLLKNDFYRTATQGVADYFGTSVR